MFLIYLCHKVDNKPQALFATVLLYLCHNVAPPGSFFTTLLPINNWLSLPQCCKALTYLCHNDASNPASRLNFCARTFSQAGRNPLLWSHLPSRYRLLCFVASNWSLCSSTQFCVLWSLFATGLPLLDPSFPQVFPHLWITLCLTFAPLSIWTMLFHLFFHRLFTYYITGLGRNSVIFACFYIFLIRYCTCGTHYYSNFARLNLLTL